MPGPGPPLIWTAVAWGASETPDWFDEKFYREKIQPSLASLSVSAISNALCVSRPYASGVRAGRRDRTQGTG